MAPGRRDDYRFYCVIITVGPLDDVLMFGKVIPRVMSLFKRSGMPTVVRIEQADPPDRPV